MSVDEAWELSSSVVVELPAHLYEDAIELWGEAQLLRPWNDAHTDLLRAVTGAESTVLACLDGTRLVGTVMVGHDGHRGWMYYLAVTRSHRGRGIGRRLVHASEDWVRARGVPKMQVMVREGNEPALGFYNRQGYEQSTVTVFGRRLGA